ncbi:hypothetical protein MN0502_22250 [Arthrobacter sp. MN05-02]|nr:hypothetical protein MN0502_22250 [Arthrobacter sp. MN05-02]
MPAVTQLHRSPTAQLAEVSGAPRPLLTPPGQPGTPTPAPVIPLRSAAGPVSVPFPGGPPARSDGLPGADQELFRRISGIARSVAQGALEVLGGSRPLQQLARWLDQENYERLQLRTNLVRCVGASPASPAGAPAASAHRHIVIRSARVCPVGPGVFEASVVAFDQKRVRAVALRIEQRRGAWRVTALEIG